MHSRKRRGDSEGSVYTTGIEHVRYKRIKNTPQKNIGAESQSTKNAILQMEEVLHIKKVEIHGHTHIRTYAHTHT